MLKQKAKQIIVIVLSLILPIGVFAQTADPAFNPNKIIEDKVFGDIQTFGGAQGIQKFLENKNSILANINPDFLVKLKEPAAASFKAALDDPEPNLGRLRSAAELIWDASQASGLNPQIILATLNKEQGLIAASQNINPGDLQRALDHAMGFNCPDSGGCGNLFPGFYYQLFGNFDSDGNRYLGAAKSLMKSFAVSGGRGPLLNGQASRTGDIVTLGNTMGGYDNILPVQTVTLANNATAALYRYTPHVFNGNYNFWKYFNAWFKYANGTLLKLLGDANTYIIENGSRQQVPAFVALARGLDTAATVTASPTELQDYPLGDVYGPVDNTIVKTDDSKTYVFINNVKHLASAFVITQRGLNPNLALNISAAEAGLFKPGPVLTPSDGTIIRGQNSPGIYLVSSGKLQLYSSYVFNQRKIKNKKIVTVPSDEINTYDQQGFVPPLDGTLIKAGGDAAIYFLSDGLRQPVLAGIFKNRGFNSKNVASLSSGEVDSLPLGNFATPKDLTFFKNSDDGTVYLFKQGSTHLISPFVAKQRGIKADYAFGQNVVNQWPGGISVAPKDGTLVKGDFDGTTYVVVSGQLRPLTDTAFKRRRYSLKNVKVLPQTEIDGYAKGDILVK